MATLQSNTSIAICPGTTRGCDPGLILPFWLPWPDFISAGEQTGRAIVYIVCLLYLYLGLFLAIGKLSAAIDVIVNVKRCVKTVSHRTGVEIFVRVPVWNQTVALLTIVLFVTCGPEVILSILDVIANNFEVGNLGPETIFGATAYNLFIATGIAGFGIAGGHSRKILQMPVFFVTTFWILFIYIWLYIILMVSTSGTIDLWEACVTAAFYPLCVLTAYAADTHLFGAFDRCKPCVKDVSPEDALAKRPHSDAEKALEELEHREKFLTETLVKLKIKHPEKTVVDIRELAVIEMLKSQPKGRSFYGMALADRILGGGPVINDKLREQIQALFRSKQPAGVQTDVHGTYSRLENDDRDCVFNFENKRTTVDESSGEVTIKVICLPSGAKGDIALPFSFTPLTAFPGVHYVEPEVSNLFFKDGEKEKFITFKITDEGKHEAKSVALEITLGEPSWISEAHHHRRSTDGRSSLGDNKTISVTIIENAHATLAIKDVCKLDYILFLTSYSWADQFRQAVAVPRGNGDWFDFDSATKKPTCRNYVSHVFTIFWKILYAFAPPPGLLYGWPAFFVYLIFVGFIVALIRDLAAFLACTIGLTDELMAALLIALGTSFPNLFASFMAARHEHSADVAVGCITGFSACSVFLGIGIAWIIGTSIQQIIFEDNFYVEAGSLSFVVVLFLAGSIIARFLVLMRRWRPIKGEIGSGLFARILAVVFFGLLFAIFVILVAVDSFCLRSHIV